VPIFERNGQKIHFVHIPKSGGMSIREMLVNSGWKNLYDDHKGQLQVAPGKNYHGHMPYSYWKDWEEVKNCEFEFAISRNPVARMSSLAQMWLRSFWLESNGAAFKAGGNDGPQMRALMVELGVVDQYASEEELRGHIGAIILPADLKMRQEIATLNNMSLEDYEYLMRGNIYRIMKRCAEVNIKKIYGRDLNDFSWIDLVEIYMQTERFDNIEREALTPLPAHKYISPQTHVYRYEQYESILEDLVAKGFIDLEFTNVQSNVFSPLVDFKREGSRDTRLAKSKFYGLYGKDFEVFGYDRNTPLPGNIGWA
jgi:hypothetical protein